MKHGNRITSQMVPQRINQPEKVEVGIPDGGATGGNQQYVRRINNDAREDEMEENMQAVGGILGNLKSMATDMGAEIEKQNSQLDRINDKGGNVGMRIDSANKRTEAILKK